MKYRSMLLIVVCALTVHSASVAADDSSQRISPQRSDRDSYESFIDSKPFAARDSAAASGRFQLLEADQTGIDFTHYWDPPAEKYNELVDKAVTGGGVAIGDYDGDGLPDVYLGRPFGGGRLYRNLGNWRFEDATQQAGLAENKSWTTGCCFVDIDNDGDLDLFACGYDCPNRLYVNDGNGVFTDRAAEFGLDFHGASIMMSFADYDLDGNMDGFLVTNRFVSSAYGSELRNEFQKINEVIRLRNGKPEVVPRLREVLDFMVLPDRSVKVFYAGQAARLYRNNGKGRFEEVAEQAGVVDYGMSLAATWWDYNDDGYPDLYLANDFEGTDRLYRNNGDGTFTNRIEQSMPHLPYFSMGCNIADLNNDGLLDLIGTDMSGATHYKQQVSMGVMSDKAWFIDNAFPRQVMRNAVYINSGAERFFEAAHLLGLANSDWTWAPKFGDFDSDGRVDVFISNGMVGDYINSDVVQKRHQEGSRSRYPLGVPPKRDANIAMRNAGDLRFEDRSEAWGLSYKTISFGAALGDLDLDGDLDLVVNNYNEPCHVYRNELASGSSLKLQLRGTRSNSLGVGSLITIETAGIKQAAYLTLARGFMSGDEPIVHFGLGDAKSADRITIKWPSGVVQRLDHVEADRTYTIREPESDQLQNDESVDVSPLFVKSAMIEGLRHSENRFDDFERQPLLPKRLSQSGPGLAMGDVDGDGRNELFVGGAMGQAGRILVQRDGRFIHEVDDVLFGDTGPLPQDAGCEDMGAAFVDVDADGDLDLYVVSGSGELEPGDELLRDRLYLNDGSGDFTKANSDVLPDVRASGSCVAACDFDRDGDLDLFVGGRCVPGAYPTTPRSMLLRNDSQPGEPLLVDFAAQAAPGLSESGMVTSAAWSDVDDDGWIDLIVTHDWGPIKLFKNQQGRLVDKTNEAGLADRLGWWNGVAGGDVDLDGDMDFVVTNYGLNSRYQASAEQPVEIYYGDFDGTGVNRIIEAEHREGRLLPIRGKHAAQKAIAYLRERFPTFHEYASATLEEIHSKERLAAALKRTVNCLESGVLLNDGRGAFSFRPFPRLAQISPSFGITLADADGDGLLDVYLVQNFLGSQRETGPLDGGMSLLLRGDGQGNFAPVWPNESGLIVPGAAASLIAADISGDGVTDFLVGVNNDELTAFEGRRANGDKRLTVQLVGPSGNPAGVGSQVSLEYDDGSMHVAEIRSGEGYLSQGPRQSVFVPPPTRRPVLLQIRWPDGTNSSRELSPNDGPVVTVSYR